MAKYRRKDAANGRTMYYKDGQLVSPKEIPEAVLRSLENDMEMEITPGDMTQAPKPDEDEADEQQSAADDAPAHPMLGDEEAEAAEEEKEIPRDSAGDPIPQVKPDGTVEAPFQKCLKCGEPAHRKRFLQLKEVYLCDTHYAELNTGKTVALMREKNIIV